MITITCDKCKKTLNDNPVDHKYWGPKTVCEDCYNSNVKLAVREDSVFNFKTYNSKIAGRL